MIIHDIEVDFWGSERSPDAPVVEGAFRRLQQRYGRDAVTPECYLAFFDQVYDALAAKRRTGRQVDEDTLSVDCTAPRSVAATSSALVPEMAIPELLKEMRRGKRVVFVDVREADEFAEGHIPGALNVTLRDLNSEAIVRVSGADYVVSYCVKDFRGFEMAKALRQAGVETSVILNPYGIKGWVSQGLPTAGTKALAESEAVDRLARCLSDEAGCAGASAI